MELKEKLINFSIDDVFRQEVIENENIAGNLAPKEFWKIAQAILSGYFLVMKGEDMVKIHPTCVEIYCHEERENGVKDYIVYHRNSLKEDKPIFPLGVLHNHVSGIDITFEKGENEKNAVRLSALVREFRVDDSGKKKERYKNKEWMDKNKIITYPTHLYEAIYSQFSIFDGGFNVSWEDGDEIELEKIEINVRKNVARFIEVNGKYIKDMCDDKNAEDKTPSGHYQKEYPKIYIDLVTVLKKNNVAYDIIPCTNDIWCRDYMPVQIDEDRFLCYRYYPDYLLKRKSDKRFITDSQEVCMRLGLKTTNTNIIMDGGNIVKVGDKVIMTEKVFQENPDMSPSSLGSKIEKLFECEVVFLPWDRSEIYGHSDGIVKPISGDSVLITNYDDYDTEYYEECSRRLSKVFKVESLHYEVKDGDSRNWAYINFLTVGKLMIFPKLNIKEDEQALSQIKQLYPDCYIEQVDIEALVADGGGLNCITWCRKVDQNHIRFLNLLNRSELEEEIVFTDEDIRYMCKYDIVRFAERNPGVVEYYMKCLSD